MTAFAAWLENPVVTRENRARWRGRAFAVLLGYTFLLALAMLWAYGTASSNLPRRPTDGLGNMAQVGHSLFQALACTQIGCWLLLAPALTATGLAWERETGVLEGIQLSPLPGYKIVGGKLLSVLFFVGLLLLVAQPISSTCFLMGGVSPGEFQGAFLLQGVTAITGALVGLSCSALCRRANTALALTFALMILWFIGSFFCAAIGAVPSSGFNNVVSGVFGRSNPFIAALELTSPSDVRSGFSGSYGWFPWFFDLDFWQASILTQMVLWVPLFWLTAHSAGRPFPEAAWLEERKKKSSPRAGQVTAPEATALSSDGVSQKGAVPQAGIQGGGSTAERPARRWDTPLVARIHSENPVFQREARSKFRLRRLPFIPAALVGCLLLFALYWYARGIFYTLDEPRSRLGLWFILNFLWLILMVLCCAIMGGSAFSREREAGTWEGLGLSLLSTGEIIGAKFRAPLLAVACYSVPLVPLLAFCTLQNGLQPSGYSYSYSYYLTLRQIGGSLLLQVMTAYFVVALGLWLSWRSKRTSFAIGWMIGLLIVAWAFVPGFILSSVSYSAQDTWGKFFQVVNPFFALGFLSDGSNYNNRSDDIFLRVLCCIGLLCASGTALLLLLRRDMEERRFGLFER